jgi:replicative DNA helicase
MSINAHDLQAERSLLGCLLLGSKIPEVVADFLAVPPEAYYNVRHTVIASLMRDMVARQIPVDPITVYAEACKQGIAGQIGDAPYLHTLMALVPTAANSGYFAEWLCELYGRRRLAEEMIRQIQQLDQLWENADRTGTAEAVARLRAACDDVAAYSGCASGERVTYLDEFLEQDISYDWLIRGLLERRDRLVITGDEGFGKSELAAQIACCAAAGIHPFTGDVLVEGGLRVGVVDCENSTNQSRRRYLRMVDAVNNHLRMHQAQPVDWRKQMAVEFRTEGLDLLSGPNVAWLERWISVATPDILVIGPLYKLHREDINGETAARALTVELDSLRARHNVAIITEAHAGHVKGDDGKRLMRPRGSSLFLGWPEFGIGLRRNSDNPEEYADVVAWRGHRDDGRQWPARLYKARAGLIPWRPFEEYYRLFEPHE